jgi:LPXTG-motif cell wall-anchored protein
VTGEGDGPGTGLYVGIAALIVLLGAGALLLRRRAA